MASSSVRTPLAQLSGKVVMLTGANSGIGKAAAREFAEMGAQVIMVCRSREKGEAARREIARKSGSTNVDLMTADLSALAEVRRLASEFAAGNSRLHVLINNAGSAFQGYEETVDSFERTMALNYFSPFLLTNLLLPLLQAGVSSRVVNVSSVAHFGARLELDDINGKRSSGMFGLQAYGRSKLALVLFTYELARRLQGTGITANCLHPGAVRTNIWSHSGAVTPLVRLASLFMRSPRKGAETVVYLASAPEVEGVSGKYFVHMKPRPSSKASYDNDLAERLWDISARLTGLSSAEA